MRLRVVRTLMVCLVGALSVILSGAYFELSTRGAPVGSDPASHVLQAWEMLHGNLLLRGWALTDVSFYTTVMPQYVLVEAVRGLRPDVVHVAGAMTYTLLVVLAGWLARGSATGAQGVTRALIAAGIMLAPQPGHPTELLFASSDHICTGIPLLLMWLIIERAGSSARRRARPLGAAAAGMLLAATITGDPLAAVIGAAPLAIVCGRRVCQCLIARREPCRYDLYLAAAAVGSVPAGIGATRLIALAGGWTTSPVRTSAAPAGMIGHNVALAGQGLLQLLGADFTVTRAGWPTVFALVHVTGVVLAGWGLWLAARRFGTADLVVQGIAVAVGLNLAAYVLTVQAVDLDSTREIMVVLPLAAVLAGRLVAGPLLAARLAPLLTVMLAAYAGMLIAATVQSPVRTPSPSLARWLFAHHLTQGLSGYWQANVLTLDSGDAVRVRAVAVNHGWLTGQDYWNARAGWYVPRRQYADFVVSPATNCWCVQKLIVGMAAEAGRPAAVYRVWPYTIAVWHRNLLARLH